MSSINDKDVQQFQQIIRNRRDEREDIQKKAFTKWINNQLAHSNLPLTITDLFHDLRDGVILLRLLEVLTGNEYKREIGKMRVHHIGNINKVFAVLGEYGIRLLSISSNDIVDGNPKLTLALLWSIIQYWQGKDLLKSISSNPQQTNIEKFLLAWCQQQTKGYKGVVIKDFTTSWQDGLAFNALIHKFRSDLFDYEDILQNSAARNLEHAFSIAKNVFKIDRYIDVEDVLSEYPDKKSILMYIMCLFQQLPGNNIVIEDKKESGISTMTISVNNNNPNNKEKLVEVKSPFSPVTSSLTSRTSSASSVSTASTPVSISPLKSTQLASYQTNRERIFQWIYTLEDELEAEDEIAKNDLKLVKKQFQKHEDFMLNLTKDQNQIGQVLEEGNRLITSPNIDLQAQEENQIKEQMKILNRQWESLRSKALERQSMLHKALMKLQIDEIELFDMWLIRAERRISSQLETMEQDLPGVERQYHQLALLQDELVAQQQITDSLQNMVIVIDDSSINGKEIASSKYTSTEIEAKLSNLSERWANVCSFVQNRWIQLQEVKIELEQVELNRNKVNRWLTHKEEEIDKILNETNCNDAAILMQHAHALKKTESEISDLRQSILALDNSLKVLSTHYNSQISIELKNLNEQINAFEKRWSKLVEKIEQCAGRISKSPLNIKSVVTETNQLDNDITKKMIITEVEETEIKQRAIHIDNTAKQDFDISAGKFIDWINSIERILSDRYSYNLNPNEIQNIVQEAKSKYLSYVEQFKNLIQTGHTITKQLKDANENSIEHEYSLRTLERRWQELYKQIIDAEQDTQQSVITSKFEDEYQTLSKAINEYKAWIDSSLSTSSKTEMQIKSKSFQSYNERLANLRRMSERMDGKAIQRVDDMLRTYDEIHSRLCEGNNRIEYMQQPSGISGTGVTSSHHSGITTIPRSSVLIKPNNQSSSTSTMTKNNIDSSTNETGNFFTLTNIYTFGEHGNPNKNSSLDNYGIKSFVEVFDSPSSEQQTEYKRNYHAKHSSSPPSSSIKRQTYTSSNRAHDYDSSHIHHYQQPREPVLTTNTTDEHGGSTAISTLSSLPTTLIGAQTKVRQWLEQVEQSLLNDKVRLSDTQAINSKKKIYKDLLNQTLEQEHIMEELNIKAKDNSLQLGIDVNRRLQEELTNYQDRLYDIKTFLSERLAKCNRIEKTLNDFERGVQDVKLWIRNAQPRLSTHDASYVDSRILENQLGRSQILQQEIREMQTTINSLNKDVVDLSQDADENLARRLREQMRELNENWSHIISSTKIHSQNIQDALKRNKVLNEEIQELEDWIREKERDAPANDGPIFYQDQLHERREQYQKLQTELNLKEPTVRNLVFQDRQDLNIPSAAPSELSQNLETLVSNWSNLQKKVDTKVIFYTDIHTLYEELKNLLHQENVWLDELQNKIYSSSNNGADAEEISEELDSLERFVKIHSKTNYDKVFEISDRLQATKVSLPATTSQINQFRIRWEQLHDDAFKKIHTLNLQISDYQHMGHQITAMFEWMKHTDNTLVSRLKDDVYADDVPGEAEKLIIEFNQYEAFLRSIDDKIHLLRGTGKNDAAKRLEQQLILLRNQYLQLQTKFRHFQKPSDFEPKHAQMRHILNDIEQNIHMLEVHSDDPGVVHNQLENCSKFYKTLFDIKSEVEYIIRTGRGIVEKQQTNEPNDLTRQIDQLKAQYNTLGAKISASKNQLDNLERHLRKFHKESSHIHDWLVKADNEILKIENKPISKNTKEEIDWIRTTRNDIKKLENSFETLKTIERTIDKEVNRPLPNLHDRTIELKRQIDQLDRRLKDRLEIVEGQVRQLEDDYQRFVQIYQEIIIRLEKLEILLSDAERIFDLNRISQVQDELRSVRIQLDDLLSHGQELVSKSEKYSKLVAPDIENITRKFEELQRRIRIIQENQEKHSREHYATTISRNTQDDRHGDPQREYYLERKYNRIHHESRHRSPSESSDISMAHGAIDEEFRKKYLRCLAYMKLIERLYENQPDSDDDSEVVHRRLSRRERALRDRPEYEEIEKIIRETEERAHIIEKTDAEQANRIRGKIRRLRDCLDNLKRRSNQYQDTDEFVRYNERYEEHFQTTDRTVPREREFDSDFIYDIDDTHSILSEPAPQFNTKYRKTVHSLDRYRTNDHSRYVPTNEEYHLQPLLRVRSLKAIDHHTFSAPSSPVLQPRYRSYERSNVQYTKEATNQQGHQDNYHTSISKSASMPNGGFPVRAPLNCVPQQPIMYRERVIDRHVAERNASHGESHRKQQQESSDKMQTSSTNSNGQTQTLNRSIPVRYETSNGTIGTSSSYRQTNGYRHEPYPTYFYNEQQHGGGADGSYRQQTFATPNVGPHPARVVY